MKIVITEPAGFIGKHLISFLQKTDAELLLVGHDLSKLKLTFPYAQVTTYTDLKTKARGYDALIYLDSINNDNPNKTDIFHSTNTTPVKNIFNIARIAGIKTFINITKLPATLGRITHNRVTINHEDEKLSAPSDTIAVVNIRLAAVYDSNYFGSFAKISKLPTIFRPLVFQAVASFKPTANITLVNKEILDAAQKGVSGEVIISDKQNGNFFYQVFKRMLDIAFVLFVIIGLWWVLLGSWLAVKLTSKGPGIFAQKRIGKNGAVFTCFKFRTMAQGTKEAGTHELTKDNVTRVGQFLRKTKIDELPQIWNILKKEMSLVGARPCLPKQQSLIDARARRGVLNEIGGITGWAQIHNVDMSDPSRITELDAEYYLLRTITLDVNIILATATGRGQGDRVK